MNNKVLTVQDLLEKHKKGNRKQDTASKHRLDEPNESPYPHDHSVAGSTAKGTHATRSDEYHSESGDVYSEQYSAPQHSRRWEREDHHDYATDRFDDPAPDFEDEFEHHDSGHASDYPVQSQYAHGSHTTADHDTQDYGFDDEIHNDPDPRDPYHERFEQDHHRTYGNEVDERASTSLDREEPLVYGNEPSSDLGEEEFDVDFDSKPAFRKSTSAYTDHTVEMHTVGSHDDHLRERAWGDDLVENADGRSLIASATYVEEDDQEAYPERDHVHEDRRPAPMVNDDLRTPFDDEADGSDSLPLGVPVAGALGAREESSTADTPAPTQSLTKEEFDKHLAQSMPPHAKIHGYASALAVGLCPPIGAAAVANSLNVISHAYNGDEKKSQSASSKALTWAIIGITAGIILWTAAVVYVYAPTLYDRVFNRLGLNG